MPTIKWPLQWGGLEAAEQRLERRRQKAEGKQKEERRKNKEERRKRKEEEGQWFGVQLGLAV